MTASPTSSRTSVGRDPHLQVARVEPRDVEQRVDDLRQPLRLGRDVAEERRALLVAEEDVLAEQRLREAVDRRQRRAQLVRHRRDEVRLHLLDEPVGRDVAEREDAAGDGADRIAHDRLADGEPHLFAPAHDRDEPIRRRRSRIGLEVPLQDVGRCTARAHPPPATPVIFSAAAFQSTTMPFAVDGDDAVGDVREDRDAALALERDALVQLRVRERRGRARREREQRVDLLLAPRARLRGVDGEHAARRALRRPRAARRGRPRCPPASIGSSSRRRESAARVLERDGRTRLHDVAGEPRARRAARADRLVRAASRRRAHDELAVVEDPDRARVGVEQAPVPARPPRRAPPPDRARSSAAGPCA